MVNWMLCVLPQLKNEKKEKNQALKMNRPNFNQKQRNSPC